MTPRILVSGTGLWAVDKPSGMVVHPAGPDSPPDLLAWLDENGGPPGMAPIHRLDAETSGVVLLSADPEVRGRVGQWLADGLVRKTYLALVYGQPRPKGNINRDLRDGRRGRDVPARTRYQRMEQLGGFGLVRAWPETGRKHQVRRHLHGLGLPLVGDTRYRAKRFRPVPGFPGRLWLHAAELELPDGRRFEAPLPPELEAHLDLLRQTARTTDR